MTDNFKPRRRIVKLNTSHFFNQDEFSKIRREYLSELNALRSKYSDKLRDCIYVDNKMSDNYS